MTAELIATRRCGERPFLRCDSPAAGARSSHIMITSSPKAGATELIQPFASMHPSSPAAGNVRRQPIIVTSPTTRVSAAGLAEAIVYDAEWPNLIGSMGEKFPEVQIPHLLDQSGTNMLVIKRANCLVSPAGGFSTKVALFLATLLDLQMTTIVLVGDDDLFDLGRVNK
jgi:Bacterial TniB protein